MSLLVGRLGRVDLCRGAARECDAEGGDDEMKGFHSTCGIESRDRPGRALTVGRADGLGAVAVIFHQLP